VPRRGVQNLHNISKLIESGTPNSTISCRIIL
jgi:hypothetical protein